MVNWKDSQKLLKKDEWKYIVYDDFEGDNFSYIKKHYKSLLAGSSDSVNLTDKYLKKISIKMNYRPAVLILNQYPDWEGCDLNWIQDNTVQIVINNRLY